MAPPSLKLTLDDTALKAAFLALETPEDLSVLLEVPFGTLRFFIYKKSNYRDFTISRKSGASRLISTPQTSLKIIQRKLSQVLQAVYGSRSSVHGFVRNRSIRSNASRHLGAEWVLNFDLESFFPSIHFGRVTGLFTKLPYRLPKKVAETIARLCCYRGVLPTGAPTSPILANMICARLDSEIKGLAWSAGCKYTRYADDITISTNLMTLSPLISSRVIGTKSWELAPQLSEIVARNGFTIQASKTRVRGKHASQEITGIRINTGLNISRTLVRQIRAMVHAMETYGETAAELEFWQKYYKRQTIQPFPAFRTVLRGKIEFLGFVKGRDDRIYVQFLQRLQAATQMNAKPIVIRSFTHETVISQSIWLLYNHKEDKQGTAFAITGGKLLTASHNMTEPMFASRPGVSSSKYLVSLVKNYPDLDLAEISINHFLEVQLPIANVAKLSLMDEVCVVGYPNYHIGDSVAFRFGKIVQRRDYPGADLNGPKVPHFITDADIVKGNSGGPVLDATNRVIGVAVKGLDAPGSLGENDQLSSFVPISLLFSPTPP